MPVFVKVSNILHKKQEQNSDQILRLSLGNEEIDLQRIFQKSKFAKILISKLKMGSDSKLIIPPLIELKNFNFLFLSNESSSICSLFPTSQMRG
jgi:hypothetical protein